MKLTYRIKKDIYDATLGMEEIFRQAEKLWIDGTEVTAAEAIDLHGRQFKDSFAHAGRLVICTESHRYGNWWVEEEKGGYITKSITLEPVAEVNAGAIGSRTSYTVRLENGQHYQWHPGNDNHGGSWERVDGHQPAQIWVDNDPRPWWQEFAPEGDF